MLATAAVVLGQFGEPGLPRPGWDLLWTGWSLPPLPVLTLVLVAGLYIQGLRVDRREHPANQFPTGRAAAFLAGLAVTYVAIGSPIEVYDTTLFGVHMIQHLLLFAVAAPLVMAGSPITLAIRASSPSFRRKVLLPVLRSKPVEAITFPPITWVLFAAVLWLTHVTAIFDIALRNDVVHEGEHAMYLFTACLFWWPVIGRDPSRWKLGYPAKLLYLFLGMPSMTFLGLMLVNAGTVIYPTYATIARDWGPDPVTDQQLAGFLMWVVGGLFFLGALLVVAAQWLAAEERRGELVDRAQDRTLRERGYRPANVPAPTGGLGNRSE